MDRNKIISKKLTASEIVDIRLACVKMFVDTASRVDMKDDIRITAKAELAWQFVTEPIVAGYEELPQKGSK